MLQGVVGNTLPKTEAYSGAFRDFSLGKSLNFPAFPWGFVELCVCVCVCLSVYVKKEASMQKQGRKAERQKDRHGLNWQ